MPLRERPQGGRWPNGRHSFRAWKDDRTDVARRAPGAVVVAARTGRSLHAANSFPPSTAMARGRKAVGDKVKARAQATASSLLAAECSRPRAIDPRPC